MIAIQRIDKLQDYSLSTSLLLIAGIPGFVSSMKRHTLCWTSSLTQKSTFRCCCAGVLNMDSGQTIWGKHGAELGMLKADAV